MDAEILARLPEIEAICELLAGAPDDERERLLREALLANDKLRALEHVLVPALLEESTTLAGALDGPFGEELLADLAETVALASEEVVGRYAISRELGRGGMAVVYEATRIDGVLTRPVALKVVSSLGSTPQSQRRLERERRILASLSHPNIATLLDGGTTADGSQFFVMELVDGEPIDTYCDRLGLTMTARIGLVLQVCAAVAHAHASLVVHCDIKPSNIFITRDGNIKLLDFGIARLLEPGSASSMAATHSFLTPAVASPEQLHGEAVTTSSDVYQLGLLLYKLATGQLPHDRSRASPDELSELVRQEPRAPSQAVAASPEATALAARCGTRLAHFLREIRGDLDAIIVQALRHDPANRYRSVDALADDLQRLLAGAPVQAVRGSPAYRFKKLIWRNRLTSAVALSAIVAVSSLTTFYVASMSRQRDAARNQAQRAQRLAVFTKTLFEATNPSGFRGGAGQTAVSSPLDAAASTMDKTTSDPRARVEIMCWLARALGEAGQTDRGLQLANDGRRLAVTAFGEHHTTVADALVTIAYLEVIRGEPAAARSSLGHALRIRERVLGTDHPAVARTRMLLALCNTASDEGIGPPATAPGP